VASSPNALAQRPTAVADIFVAHELEPIDMEPVALTSAELPKATLFMPVTLDPCPKAMEQAAEELLLLPIEIVSLPVAEPPINAKVLNPLAIDVFPIAIEFCPLAVDAIPPLILFSPLDIFPQPPRIDE
jgi:hypothetical protein